jgi:hypothetical protein
VERATEVEPAIVDQIPISPSSSVTVANIDSTSFGIDTSALVASERCPNFVFTVYSQPVPFPRLKSES